MPKVSSNSIEMGDFFMTKKTGAFDVGVELITNQFTVAGATNSTIIGESTDRYINLKVLPHTINIEKVV